VRGPSVAHRIDPLQDPRWDDLVGKHSRASVFHSSAWLQALSRTYGYTPVAFTTSPSGQSLDNGILFCRVESWLTGRRLVSLPFSDHCEPLVDTEEDLKAFSEILGHEVRRERWRYLELRPLSRFSFTPALHQTTLPYSFHCLDLSPDLATLFGNLHKSSIQRKIRRAEREGLKYFEGSSEVLLDHFCRLFAMTRKRHRLPPPPRKWFANLMECFGQELKIRVAFMGEQLVAAMITIRHKSTMYYKYGCSDARYHNLGSMPFLYWKAIEDAKHLNCRLFDLGRTDEDQPSLITFKSRWGATRSTLTYSRYRAGSEPTHALDLNSSRWKSSAAKYVLGHLPQGLLSMTGRVLYRHSG
jgi:CelD/BcsL family acetyltransferase involved in cellulose biosynthesis